MTIHGVLSKGFMPIPYVGTMPYTSTDSSNGFRMIKRRRKSDAMINVTVRVISMIFAFLRALPGPVCCINPNMSSRHHVQNNHEPFIPASNAEIR